MRTSHKSLAIECFLLREYRKSRGFSTSLCYYEISYCVELRDIYMYTMYIKEKRRVKGFRVSIETILTRPCCTVLCFNRSTPTFWTNVHKSLYWRKGRKYTPRRTLIIICCDFLLFARRKRWQAIVSDTHFYLASRIFSRFSLPLFPILKNKANIELIKKSNIYFFYKKKKQ